MILLIPTSPEVPKARAPKLWHALVMILLLAIAQVEVYDTLIADAQYLENLQGFVVAGKDGTPQLRDEAQAYLKLRPLLRIAPAKGDWDLKRLLFANFIHGSFLHLFLNLIGVFAGMRICSSFIPFACSLSIFIVGGCLGLWVSLLVSTEVSEFIPHVGASAGLFALMGTYYVYNFRFRTRYFYWFPNRHGDIKLKTSWFFFLDVVLLEVILSAGQLFPERIDSVDHLAHVVGFFAGTGLACFLRFSQRWPPFLQTRAEFLYWAKLVRPQVYDPVLTPLGTWLELLELNPYNDRIKLKVSDLLFRNSDFLADSDLRKAFRFFSPTFVRLHPQAVAQVLLELLQKKRHLPPEWLVALPYDGVIRLARFFSQSQETLPYLFQFLSDYRRAHPEGGDIDRKLELLTQKLSGVIPRAKGEKGGNSGTGTATKSPRATERRSPPGKAKGAS